VSPGPVAGPGSRAGTGAGSGPALHLPVQDALLRTLAVLRALVLLNTLVLYAVRADHYERPAVGWLVLLAVSAWTAFAVWEYGSPHRRRAWLFVVDLLVAVSAILLTPYVKGDSWNATLPGFWVMGVVLAWAIVWRWVGGLVAGVAVSAADLTIRGAVSQQTYGNIFLLVVGGAVVGQLSGLLQQTANERDRAERAAASASERQRLARVVHDGVLQVLALVQRRAPELGSDGAELGRLAGEQETRLRALVQQDSREVVASVGDLDLGQQLALLQNAHVHVVTPGTSTVMPAETCTEVVSVVEACLSNVRHHVGADAEAWVLLEDLADSWVVSVRDEGPGIPPGRLEAAAREGRLGVAQSIVGRMGDLGGTAELVSTPGQGTEWELSLPREQP
jgi:signal transduction histidine kinase